MERKVDPLPFRLDEHRAKIQFITSASMPHNIYKACLKTGTPSNTRYVQEAVCARLAQDLGVPVEELLNELPPARSMSGVLFGTDRKPVPRTLDQYEEVE
jgi:hypothetical protein